MPKGGVYAPRVVYTSQGGVQIPGWCIRPRVVYTRFGFPPASQVSQANQTSQARKASQHQHASQANQTDDLFWQKVVYKQGWCIQESAGPTTFIHHHRFWAKNISARTGWFPPPKSPNGVVYRARWCTH